MFNRTTEKPGHTQHAKIVSNDPVPWSPSGTVLRAMREFAGADPLDAAAPLVAGAPARATPEAPDERLWAIVLAGGRGARLRPLVRLVHGDERPKQYAALIDARSMLRHTLDRVALRIPPERTVVVVSQDDARYIAAEFGGARRPHVLVQPSDRGTAAGVLLPVHWISWREPEATVAVFPSDHFVLGEAALMDHVAAVSRERPAWMVLLGAPPSEPDPGNGWIETGERLDGSGALPIWRVRRFWEKPSPEAARTFLVAGYLWSTFIFVARVTALLDVGSSCLPDLSDLLTGIEVFTGTAREAGAIQQAYARAARADFSRAILEPCASTLSVSRLPGTVTWSDWGTPERVLRTLRGADISPAWLRWLDRTPAATAPRHGASDGAAGWGRVLLSDAGSPEQVPAGAEESP